VAGNVVALRRSVRRWRWAAALAAAAAVVLLAVVAVDRLNAPQTTFVATLTADGAAPAFVLTVDTAANTLQIRRVADAAPPDKSYELWAVEPGAQPKSLGVVEQASLKRSLPYSPKDLVFAISLEPKGGSPTGVATGPIVFSGPLVRAR
jgi:anti-sigma-K factor RskA